MIVYIYKKIDEGEKIGCANNIMSKVISEWANDKRQKGKHVGFYDFLKNLPSANIKKPHCSKK